jgi:hypothetical protein
MKSFKQLRESELAKQVLASAKKVSPTAHIDTRSPAERKADMDKMLAARAAAKPKVTNQPSKPSTPEQQMKNQNASMAASYAKHKPGQYVGDSVELEGNVVKEESELDEAAQGHTIEAHGIKGMKRTPWRKTFKHAEHLNDWAEKNDADVHGTRDLEKAKKVNLSSVVKEESDVYDKSEENKRSADAAKKQGNMFDHHMHMADHHDNLAQWHAEKGRSSMSEIHAQKSEEHHEQAMKLKEETSIAEALSAAARMQKALQKAKEDRERSERNAERLLNPVKKPVQPEPVKEENLEEGSFKYHMDKAIAAHEKGDDKKKAYHLENARTAKFAMKTADYANTRELLDKHKQMSEEVVSEEKPGLYANIHAKRKRIAAGSGERMRKPGSNGAPTAKAFKQAQKTVKENIDDGVNEGIARLISKSIKNVTATKKTPQEKADIRLNNLNK